MEMPASTLLASVAFTADRTSNVLRCLGATLARFWLSGVQTGTPVGVFKVQGSDDPRVEDDILRGTSTATWVELEVPETAVHGLGTGQAWASGTITWDGTNALQLLVLLEHPPLYLRVFADYTSGGNGSSLIVVRGSKRGA